MERTLVEASKEAARLVLMALVSYLLTEGVINSLLTSYFGTYLAPEIRLQFAGVITVVLRSADKWLHEREKAKDPKSESVKTGWLGLRGLTGF